MYTFSSFSIFKGQVGTVIIYPSVFVHEKQNCNKVLRIIRILVVIIIIKVYLR